MTTCKNAVQYSIINRSTRRVISFISKIISYPCGIYDHRASTLIAVIIKALPVWSRISSNIDNINRQADHNNLE